MAVYFVERSHYTHRGCFGVTRLEGDSVLGWFRLFWQTERGSTTDPRYDPFVRLLGSLPERVSEDGWPVPKSMKQLADRLEEAVYLNEIKHGGHHVQFLTDDDELESAVYIFDDHYAAKHPDRAAFLVREDWRLPDGMATGPFTTRKVRNEFSDAVIGEGRVFTVHFAAYDSGGLSDLVPEAGLDAIEGVRVPDLPRLFFTLPADEQIGGAVEEVIDGLAPAVKAAKGTEALLLKAVAANPNDMACWNSYSDWLLENGRPTLLERSLKRYAAQSGSIRKTRDPKKDVVLVQAHVAQASKHVARWGNTDLYHHLVFFDDLWANAHPHLASSLLRAANRWDPL